MTLDYPVWIGWILVGLSYYILLFATGQSRTIEKRLTAIGDRSFSVR